MKTAVPFLTLLGLVAILISFPWDAKKTSQTEKVDVFQTQVEEALPTSREIIPKVTEIKVAPKMASHPLVRYENPGQIRSFNDPKLKEAFNVYFSLIGEAKDRYPYATSGFDTEANARLALKTISGASYDKTGAAQTAEFETVLMAISHLTHSSLPDVKEEIALLQDTLKSRIKEETSSVRKELYSADLIDLYGQRPTPQDLVALYQSSQDRVLRGAASLRLLLSLEQDGQNDETARAFFSKNKIPFPKEPTALTALVRGDS